MKFIGRKLEIETLLNRFKNDSFEGILIYGRRRIGKSELIKHSFTKVDCKQIYFECIESNEKTNIAIFSNLISRIFNLGDITFSSFEKALRFIFEKSVNEKIILAIDEFPYLRKMKDVDSIISSLIDEFHAVSKLKLIVSGSQIDIMSALLSHDNALYGRINTTIPVKQQNYYDSSLFYPKYSPAEKVMIYSVFGGVPFYNQFVDDKISVKENIINLIANESSRFLPEIELRLKTEIKKMDNANEVFLALAKGNVKFSDILNNSHVSSAPTLADTLDKLKFLELISKITPINDENNIKKTSYKISDNLSNFYYRYIYKNYSIFKTMNPNSFYDEFIVNDFKNNYVPKAFEMVFKQFLYRMNYLDKIKPTLHKIGTYYYDDKKNITNGQFDVVTLDKNGYTFYEVKFTKSKIDQKVIDEEIKQTSRLNLKPYKLGFVSKSGFSDGIDKNKFVTYCIEDLYE